MYTRCHASEGTQPITTEEEKQVVIYSQGERIQITTTHRCK